MYPSGKSLFLMVFFLGTFLASLKLRTWSKASSSVPTLWTLRFCQICYSRLFTNLSCFCSAIRASIVLEALGLCTVEELRTVAVEEADDALERVSVPQHKGSEEQNQIQEQDRGLHQPWLLPSEPRTRGQYQ